MDTDVPIILIAGIASGLSWVIRKPLSSGGHRATSITTATMLTNAVISIPLLFFRFGISADPLLWFVILASVASFALSVTFLYRSYRTTDLSLVTILQRVNIILVAAFGVVLLGERISPRAAAGIFLLFTAVLTVLWQEKRIRFTQGIFYALVAAVFGSVASILDKIVLTGFSPFTYVFINNLLVGLVFVWRRGTVRESLAFIRRYPWQTLSSSVLGVISFALVLLVLSRTAVSVTVPVFKTVSFFIPVLFGVVLYRETKHLSRTLLGSLLATAGILLIY